MSNTQVCRICLQEIAENAKFYFINNDNDLKLYSKLLDFYPQIDLSITENPVSCIECTIMIGEIYQFKNMCAQNQTILRRQNGLVPLENVLDKTDCIEELLSNNSSSTLNVIKSDLNETSLSKTFYDDSKLETYKCVVCAFSTENVSVFTCHWKNHTNVRLNKRKTKQRLPDNGNTYVCDMCEYKARTKGTLKQHRRLHTGEKSFKCKLCDYRGRQLSNLQSHMFKHSGNVPYRCKDCKYKTPYKAALIQHERLHTGEKPFKCKLCKYRGRQLSNLQLHTQKHHGY